MKKLCILTLLFFIGLPVLNVFAACDALAAAVDAAQAAVTEADNKLGNLKRQNLGKWIARIGKALDQDKEGNPSRFGEQVEDAGGQHDLNKQIKAAEEALAAAEAAHSTAYYSFMVCYQNHLLEEITGPCGHTYRRIDRSDHAEVTGMCGHTYYYCQSGGHGYISSSKCSKCNSYYFTCQMSCPAGGVHH